MPSDPTLPVTACPSCSGYAARIELLRTRVALLDQQGAAAIARAKIAEAKLRIASAALDDGLALAAENDATIERLREALEAQRRWLIYMSESGRAHSGSDKP